MKILHTSDWHLGQVFYGYDRTEEYIDFFTQLKEIVRFEMPDAMLVSGDIFDVSNPSSAISRIFKDRVLELQAMVPDMTIIIIAGNHDSASRIDVDRNLWKSSGIHVIGSLDRKDGQYDFSEVIIKISDKGYVAAIPYVNKAGESHFASLERELEEINTENLPVVVMAHLAVTDSDMQGHRDKIIGGFDSVDVAIFGNGFDYVALGHIHKSQELGDGRVAYCGTPMAVSFDEEYKHTISMVTVERGKAPDIEKLEIKPLRALKTIPEEGVEFKKALRALDRLDEKDMAYIRLNVVQESDLPVDCMEQAVARTKDKNCRFCTFKYTSKRKKTDPGVLTHLKPFELKEMQPIEVAETFLRSTGVKEELLGKYLSKIEQLQTELKEEDLR